ncbi:MAG: hypothetical protein GX037_07070 [Trueperella sp.]|nr:hypothetical protein [Trueperella sp.]
MKDNKTPAQQWDGVRELHDQLAAGNQGYRRVHPDKNGDDGTSLGWIHYEDWLWYGIWDGIYLLDKHLNGDWEPHYDRLNEYPIETIPQASVGELTAWFILFGNRERIYEGLISNAVDDGTILALSKRFLELIDRPAS